METRTLIAGAMVTLVSLGVAGLASAKPLSPRFTFEHRHPARETRRAAVPSPPGVTGVIPRAIRGGNPLQMLNPAAPARYGTAAESASVDPEVPGRVDGIILYSISF
jgi:hypothetical protein